jgi:AcrR family transcriptional regulator
MSWSKDDKSGGPRGYHHGNLKEALVRAALELIAQKGPAGFTFAEAARWAGVSPAAPYRHFRDRDELITNVALRGFERFAHLMERWRRDAPPVVCSDSIRWLACHPTLKDRQRRQVEHCYCLPSSLLTGTRLATSVKGRRAFGRLTHVCFRGNADIARTRL